MTLEELQALINQGDVAAMKAALDVEPAATSSKLAKAACKTAADLVGQYHSGTLLPGQTWEQKCAQMSILPPRIMCAALATYRLGTWEDVQRVERLSWMNEMEHVQLFELLFDWFERHPPAWLEKWVAFGLDKRSYFDWRWVRRLMRAGVCARPTTDNYILRMPRDLESLRADPDLLRDEVWCVFRQLPPAKWVVLDSHEFDHVGQPEFPMTFAGALRQLASEGLIERQRLLTASLEALQLGRQANDATWFYRFHEFLAPGADERARLQHLYCDLLANQVPTVIAFALDALQELAKAKRLDGPAFLAQVPRAFRVSTKGVPVAALKLLGLVAKEDSLKVDVAAAACAALAHDHADVQKAALTLLEGLKVAPPAHVVAEFESRLDSVAASLQDRARQLCDQWRPAAAGEAPPAAKSAPAQESADEAALLAEAANLDAAHQEQAGIADCLRALQGQHTLSPVNIDPTRIRHLVPDGAQAPPIQTLDELIEELTPAIEHLDDADRFERLLDGLSRLCAERPPDFEARIAPLGDRMRKLTRDRGQTVWVEIDLVGGLMLAIRSWRRGAPGPRVEPKAAQEMEPPPAPPSFHTRRAPSDVLRVFLEAKEQSRPADSPLSHLKGPRALTFLKGRLDELGARLERGDARPLLATPTHRGGWIDAAAFVERLTVLEQAGLDPESFDLRQALLRLAPDGRDPILGGATHLTGSRQQAVLWARDLRKPAALPEVGSYIAAEAGRNPSSPIPVSENPPVLVPLTIAWNAVVATAGRGSAPPGLALTVTITPDVFTLALFRYPPLTLWPMVTHAGGIQWSSGKAASLAQVWPGNLAPVFASSAVAIVSELETTSNTVRHFPEFLKPLFAPETPFSEMAQLLLAVSLLAKSADLRGLALDALFAVIEDGRCLGDELGTVLGRLLPSGMVRSNRLAEALQTASRASLLHKSACVRIVQTMFRKLEGGQLPDDVHHLLAPLLEWLTELKQPLGEALVSTLTATSGSSKTAKLARSLAQRTSPADAGQQRLILLQALRGRLRAAHRREAVQR